MERVIKVKLSEIEEKENVKIVHAIESGSRAWGFASPDSDYDVRFIYVRPKEYYLKLDKARDVIEWQLDDTLDINGWDLQKALRLLYKSNPTLFEWSYSPIIYKTTSYYQELKKEIDSFFSCKASLYHYLSTAHSNYRKYLKGDYVRLKNYFYVVRPILACKWILDKKVSPPVLFSELMEAELEASMKPIIGDLLKVKMEAPEVGEGKRIGAINTYIESSLAELKGMIDLQENDKNSSWDRLNELFLMGIEL
ncbi:nucleotidyltransferase domain-containing protein [Bacillus sp. V3B]|uniref:nucleotidyltransferase domain-containing protein n=1 Tax=Bacillus sp. V3B TaxID=2804915 RepID=UPI00210C906F|nr:nucleotidyltransferase domain-containing protein [Bacillus sp. V3B]MCQ6276976.1 nucleotidyltransferase domain-containing protein [Bacillus sp. V3B]